MGARRQLALRGEEVARGLSAVGLRSRPLGTREVLALYRDVLSPGLARVQSIGVHPADQMVPVVRARRMAVEGGAL